MDLAALEADVGMTDAREGLRAVVALRRLAARLEARHVAQARHQGLSWAEIAAELEVTRQTVHKKHGRTNGPRRWSNDADL